MRERLRALQRRGILNGYWLYPDPSIFGRDELLLMFRGDWNREDARKALEVRDVAFVALKLDGSLTVQTWTRNREQSVRDLTNRLGTTTAPEQSFTPRRPREPLPLVAWRIMDALVDDPRTPFKDLCRTTELTPKTVRKHLVRLIQDEVVYLLPRLGALADSGEIVYHLSVRGSVGMKELTQILGDVVLVSAPREPPIKYLLCRSSSLAEVTGKTRAISKLSIEGVEAVEVTLNRELMVNTGLLHSLIREQIHGHK